jgi:hypothetical protein
MAKIISFPTKKSNPSDSAKSFKNNENVNAKQNEKAMVILSLLSILIAAIFMNDHVIQQQNYNTLIAGGDREMLVRNIANVYDKDNLSFQLRDIEWEHTLAQKLSDKKNNILGGLAQKPTALDELKYGFFNGRYEIYQTMGQISEIDFIENPNQEKLFEGIKLLNQPDEFLQNYKSVLGLDFKTLKKVSDQNKSTDEQVFELLLDNNQPVRKAVFKFDSKHNLLNLKIQ